MNADVKDAGSDTSQVYCSVAENVCSRLLKVWTLLKKKKPQNKRVTQIGAVGSAALHTVMEETTTDRVTAGRHSDRFGCKRCTPDTSFRTNGAGRKHKTAETRFPSVKLFSLLEQAA